MSITIRPALPADVRGINTLVEPMTHTGGAAGRSARLYYEAVQEFLVATDEEGRVIGCGALHVMWEDLAEVRTLAVHDDQRGTGLGHRLLDSLLERAVQLGLERVFCLTFEVEFFSRHGFEVMSEGVDPELYNQLLRSPDEGIAEFLDLARVKPNTLGNTRMIKLLAPSD